MSAPMAIPPASDPFSHRRVDSFDPDVMEQFSGFTTTFAFIEPPFPVGSDEPDDTEPDAETVQRILARLKR